MHRHIFVVIALFAMPFAAMASKADVLPIPLGERLSVEADVVQKGLFVLVNDNGGLGIVSPLAGMIVNGVAKNNAETRIAPMNEALASYRLDETLKARLQAKLASGLALEGISPNPELSFWERGQQVSGGSVIVKDVPLQAMVILPQYFMSQDFDRLTVKLHVQVVDRERKANGQYKARARATRIYTFNQRLEETKVEENAAVWHSLPPRALAALLDEGIDHVIDMMIYDFSAEGRSEWDANVRNGRATLDGHVYGGKEVRRGDGWIWLRSGAPAQILMQRVVVNPAPFKMGINGFRVIDPAALVASADSPAGAATELPASAPPPGH